MRTHLKMSRSDGTACGQLTAARKTALLIERLPLSTKREPSSLKSTPGACWQSAPQPCSPSAHPVSKVDTAAADATNLASWPAWPRFGLWPGLVWFGVDLV